MSLEGQQQDKKSLRAVTGKTADWHERVKDCVAFANANLGAMSDNCPITVRYPGINGVVIVKKMSPYGI